MAVLAVGGAVCPVVRTERVLMTLPTEFLAAPFSVFTHDGKDPPTTTCSRRDFPVNMRSRSDFPICGAATLDQAARRDQRENVNVLAGVSHKFSPISV